MTVKQAIKILRRFNKWRRGGEGKQPDPKQAGEAIDVAVVPKGTLCECEYPIIRQDITEYCSICQKELK